MFRVKGVGMFRVEGLWMFRIKGLGFGWISGCAQSIVQEVQAVEYVSTSGVRQAHIP